MHAPFDTTASSRFVSCTDGETVTSHRQLAPHVSMRHQVQSVREHLAKRYAGDFQRTVTIRNFLESVCSQHLELRLGDDDFVQKLCSGDDARYWEQLSEVLLANELRGGGLTLTPSRDGPDFLLEGEGKKIWIEVICPEPTGIPAEWLANGLRKAGAVPHEAILLRWTAAIKEKAEKLLGSTASGTKGYIEKGVVGPSDAYVIAVNARRLRGPHFASIAGISQFPYAAEAVFAIGPLQIHIDRHTLEAVGSDHQHRPLIRKPNGADVPAYTFLDPKFQPISAIWAADIDETWVIGNMKPMAIIHNPNATNALPAGLLPSESEYIATPSGDDMYEITEKAGPLRR